MLRSWYSAARGDAAVRSSRYSPVPPVGSCFATNDNHSIDSDPWGRAFGLHVPDIASVMVLIHLHLLSEKPIQVEAAHRQSDSSAEMHQGMKRAASATGFSLTGDMQWP